MQVSKWGNSLALRLPAAVVDALNLKAGDHIGIQIMGGRDDFVPYLVTIIKNVKVRMGSS